MSVLGSAAKGRIEKWSRAWKHLPSDLRESLPRHIPARDLTHYQTCSSESVLPARFSKLPQSYVFDNDYLMGSGARGRLRLPSDLALKALELCVDDAWLQLDLGGGSATQVSGNHVPAATKCPNIGIQIEDDLGCAAAKIYGNGDQGPPRASEPGNGFFISIIVAEAMDCDPSAGDVPAGQHGRLGVQKVHKTMSSQRAGSPNQVEGSACRW